MKFLCTCIFTGFILSLANAQNKATIKIDDAKPGAAVSPYLHGIFFEEISHGGEGGLYAELIQNRGFEESRLPLATTLTDGFIVPARTPHFSLPFNKASDWKMEWPLKSQWPAWNLETNGQSRISLSLTQDRPLNNATPNSLQVTVNNFDPRGKNNLVNTGFWGMNIIKGDSYLLSFYARTAENFKAPLTASLQSADGTILASYTFPPVYSNNWKKYSCKMTAKQTDGKARFALSFGGKGTIWLDMISLFPEKTFKNRPNGLRTDLAQYIADLKPSFVRWPGGCFVEGINVENTPNWKKSLGPVEKRPGTYSVWGYWSSDGFGYHEYLQFCEDIHAAALYVFNIGVSCDFRSGTFVPDEKVDSVINDILDGIEYAIGPVNSRWGKLRAANGHPQPFPLQYIEVGNEQSGSRYAGRYNRFYTAIKHKYPAIKIIASMGIGDVNKRTLDSMKTVDIADEHAYKSAGWAAHHPDHFDKYKRGNWDLYVGEYATNNGVGAGNMKAALSDAVYMMSMERNSDLVKMSSYAPLLVNVNDIDWPVNLINFNAAESFARISYYAIKLFNENKPTVNLATNVEVAAPPAEKEDFSGGVGLATWDTQTEYKDLVITQHGKTVYKSDFITNLPDWQLLRGSWKVADSALYQAADGAQQLALLGGRKFGSYTLSVKARKKDGVNAFIIPFAVQDSNTFMRAHIGSWVNSHCVIEKVTNGYDVSDLTDQVKLKNPIEKDKWYDIKIDVQPHEIRCYLGDTLLLSYREATDILAISGKDNHTGDIIVKMVNTGGMPCATEIQVQGNKNIHKKASLITLAAATDTAENSFQHPKEYIPKMIELQNAAQQFELTLAPYSINVLRLRQDDRPKNN